MQSSIQRAPIPSLRLFIESLWASSHQAMPEHRTASPDAERERMIPAASMHLVFRFSDQPIRIFRSIDDARGDSFRGGVVGGIRSAYYVKDIAARGCTVGASLRPGACKALFAVPADEIAGRHIALEDLLGNAATSLHERLQETTGLERRLQVLESFLAKRVPLALVVHPAIAHALNRFSHSGDIGTVVEETGYSHRHFINLFRHTVGLAPRIYTRLLRFQKTLKHGIDVPSRRWIDVALEAGYADQAHFNREFRTLAGISPTEYLMNRTGDSHHVPIRGQIRSIHGSRGKA